MNNLKFSYDFQSSSFLNILLMIIVDIFSNLKIQKKQKSISRKLLSITSFNIKEEKGKTRKELPKRSYLTYESFIKKSLSNDFYLEVKTRDTSLMMNN